jgi:hypothetical protein
LFKTKGLSGKGNTWQPFSGCRQPEFGGTAGSKIKRRFLIFVPGLLRIAVSPIEELTNIVIVSVTASVQQEHSFTSNVDTSQTSGRLDMRTILVGLIAAAGIAIAAPVVPASAQVTVDTPVGGVSVGHRDHYRDYNSPRYRGYRAYNRVGGCRTVTITRDDGSFKRIRRCD